MQAVNLFIGGTGIEVALYIERYRTFYGLPNDLPVFALDTDGDLQRIAKQELGYKLTLAPDGWSQRVRVRAAAYQAESFASLYSSEGPQPLHSFGDVILRSASTVALGLHDDARLYTHRGLGWLSWEDIVSRRPRFVTDIFDSLLRVAEQFGGTPTLNVIASIAGGTGSGLFIPVITTIRKMMDEQHRALDVHAYLVTPSTFDNNWRAGNSPHSRSRSRGYAGAFAAFREVLALTETSDPWSDRERRTVTGLPYCQGPGGNLRPLLQRVWWWGRRVEDAAGWADETFVEAGRFLTLMNDGAFAQQLAGALHAGDNRRIAAVTTIEYPRLERAEAISAAAVAHLAGKILEGSHDGSTGILNLEPVAKPRQPPLVRPPLLEFIRAERAGDMMAMAREPRPAAFLSVKTHLLDPMKLIKNGTPSSEPGDSLINRISRYESDCIFSGTNDQWEQSLARANDRLAGLRTATMVDVAQYLVWLYGETQSWIAEAVGMAAEVDIDPGTTWPSLARFDRSLRALVEDLDFARVFFSQPVRESVSRPMLSVDSLEAEVRELRRGLERLQTPAAKPKPPTAWYLNALIGWELIVTGLVVGLLAVAQTEVGPNPFALGGVVLVLGIAHLVVRSLNFQTVGNQRRQLERRWVAAWHALVEAEMLRDYWSAAKEICVALVGADVQSDTIGSVDRVSSRTTTLGGVLAQVDRGRAWMEELRRFAGQSENERGNVHRKSWLAEVGRYERPSQASLDSILPPLKLVATIQTDGVRKRISSLDFMLDGTETSILSCSGWTPSPRTDSQQEQHYAGLLGLYSPLNKSILSRISARNLIAPSFAQAMQQGGWDTHGLARELEQLVAGSLDRGLGAHLTRPVQPALAYLCIPPGLAPQVAAALQFAAGDPSLWHAAQITPARIIQTSFVGEAIAYVQVATFEPEATGQHPRLADVSEYARHEYYGVGHGAWEEGAAAQQDSIRNTEHHLLPELSAAARVEVEAGLFAPLSPLIVQRLHGSHHAAPAIPTMFELFYLCRHKGYLSQETVEGSTPRSLWVLQLGGQAQRVPLVSWAAAGPDAFDPQDGFGAARRQIATLDAFRLCLMNTAFDAIDSPMVGAPAGAEVQTPRWREPSIGTAIGLWRTRLFAEWSALGGAANAAQRETEYAEMMKLAVDDAQLMSPDLKTQWEHVAAVIFRRGAGNLG